MDMAATGGKETITRSAWTRIGSGSVADFVVQLFGDGEVKLAVGTSEPGDSADMLRLRKGSAEASLTLDSGDNLYARAVLDNGGAGCVVGWMAK